MCLGVPLQVRAVSSPATADCAPAGDHSETRSVNTGLLEQPPRPGDWLLVHVDVAIRPLDPDEARQISDALSAVTLAAAGEPFEHLIADLVDREPELPAHLRQEHEEKYRYG